jgi:Ca2+-binding EF-hand superfamily protein
LPQDELKIGDDEFENLQSLYQLFDLDKDGILNFKEYEKLLRCLGYRLSGKNHSSCGPGQGLEKKL